MLVCVQDPVHEVRQSTFALLGDIVTYYSPQVLQGALSQFLKYIGFELMHNDDIDGERAVVNAVWCLGIISERIDLSEYVLDLSRVLSGTGVHKYIGRYFASNLGKPGDHNWSYGNYTSRGFL